MKGAVDVAIIGASIAGTTAALSILGQGMSVCLVDKAHFPRRKSCGEGLSILAINELALLGINLNKFPDGAIPYYGFSFCDKHSRSDLRVYTDVKHAQGVGISRFHLDHCLIEAVIRSGGEVLLGEEPTILKVGEYFCVRAHGTTKFARRLIFATGAYSKLSDTVGVPRIPHRGRRCAVRIDVHSSLPTFKGLLPIVIDEKFQAVCTPVRPHQVTIGIMSRSEDGVILKAKSLNGIVEKVQERISSTLTVTDEPLGVPLIDTWMRPSMMGNIFCIGDAHRQLDPIGGMGMTQAVLTARVAADTISRMAHSSCESRSLLMRSHHERNADAIRDLAAYTKLIYAALAHPFGRVTLGRLKSGALAKEILRHDRGSEFPRTPTGIASQALLYIAGRF